MPGIQRTTGSVVYPAGGNPQIGIPSIPFSVTNTNFGLRLSDITQGRPVQGRPMANRPIRRGGGGSSYVYAYPVYVGGGYYMDNAYPQEPAPQQPNVMVIYPPQQAAPVIVQYPSDSGYPSGQQPATMYQQPARPVMVEPEQQQTEASHYMIAFKDHSIYAAVAYWVDGDTLHYFTTGNTHNQASIALVDRDLTAKLNQDSGLEVKLPPLQ